MAEVTDQKGKAAQDTGEVIVRRKIRPTVEDPVSLVFRDGPYRGQSVDLGTAITKVSGNQSATWNRQDGHSIRTGSNFKAVSPRVIRLEVDFYSEFSDISHHVENLMCLQEIDPETGKASTLFYQEGPDISVTPVVCVDLNYEKGDPFLGDRGFRHAIVKITLEVLGGKVSEHRWAKPFTDTELTKVRKSTTKQERERQGTAALVEQTFINCLSTEDSAEVSDLIQKQKLSDPGTIARLKPEIINQIAVAGMVPPDVLQQNEVRVRQSVAIGIAKNLDGVGPHSNAVARAIAGGGTAGVPADFLEVLPQLQADYELLSQSILKQDLSADSAVFSNPSANQHLINFAGCGLSVRPEASKLKGAGLSPEQRQFFDQELGDQAGDVAARDQFILERLNKFLKKEKPDEIRKTLGLSNQELAQVIKDSGPFETKSDFVNRISSDSTVTGFSIWEAFVNHEVDNAGTIAVDVEEP